MGRGERYEGVRGKRHDSQKSQKILSKKKAFIGSLWLRLLLNLFKVNMKLIPVLLRGKLGNLSYNFGSVYPVTQGEWEMCIKTVAFSYKKEDSQTVPPNVNRFLCFKSNYVDSLTYINSQTETSESVLGLIRLKIKPGEKVLNDFADRDFFCVSAPSQKFEFRVLNSDGSEIDETIKQYMHVQALILFRRRR